MAKQASAESKSTPKFPYTTKPGSLRKFLQAVPTKPKPPKIIDKTLQAWGFKDSNDVSMLRVLKSIGLLNSSGETTESYAAFMKRDSGPAVLGSLLQSTYKTLFENVADPARASTEDLTNFFNIYSGGSEQTIQHQVQTFKALSENAQFHAAAPSGGKPAGVRTEPSVVNGRVLDSGEGGVGIHIDLHIHLPENKTKVDYDSIIQSIAEHILGRRSASS